MAQIPGNLGLAGPPQVSDPVSPQRCDRVVEHVADDVNAAVNRGKEVTTLHCRYKAGGEAVGVRHRVEFTPFLNPAQACGQMPLPCPEGSVQRGSVVLGFHQLRSQGAEWAYKGSVFCRVVADDTRHPGVEVVPRDDGFNTVLSVEDDRDFPLDDRKDQLGLVGKW